MTDEMDKAEWSSRNVKTEKSTEKLRLEVETQWLTEWLRLNGRGQMADQMLEVDRPNA